MNNKKEKVNNFDYENKQNKIIEHYSNDPGTNCSIFSVCCCILFMIIVSFNSEQGFVQSFFRFEALFMLCNILAFLLGGGQHGGVKSTFNTGE